MFFFVLASQKDDLGNPTEKRGKLQKIAERIVKSPSFPYNSKANKKSGEWRDDEH